MAKRFPIDLAITTGDALIPSTHDGVPQDDRSGDTPWIETKMGPNRDDRLHASGTWHVYRLSGGNRQNDGTQGCIAPRNRIRHPNDSVLHQSWREESERYPTRGTRAGEAHPAATSREAESGRRKKAIAHSGTANAQLVMFLDDIVSKRRAQPMPLDRRI